MKKIIVNNGSVSKKYALFDSDKEIMSAHYEMLPEGFVVTETAADGEKEAQIDRKIFDKSFSDFIGKLLDRKLLSDKKEISAIGVRIVAPGKYFQEHRLIDDKFLFNLDDISDLSPLHVKPVQKELSDIRAELGNSAKIFSISDSAFHGTITTAARLYALPREMMEKLGLYRYGYHGISVSSVVNEINKGSEKYQNIVVCHLGGGSSITAVKGNQSFDTTMGFSPLEGLPMATRSGDVDPNVLISIVDSEGFDTAELQEFLYKKCGMKGLSGISGDTRVILDEIAKGNKDAENALDLYVYQIQKTIGAFFTALGGLDALIFTGTIGERSAEVRRRICDKLSLIGVKLNPGKNKLQINGDGQISSDDSRVRVLAVRTKEAEEMARIIETLV